MTREFGREQGESPGEPTGGERLRTAVSPLLAGVDGLVHGFERRPPGEKPESREASRLRVAGALGRVFFMKQVHGTALLEAPWEGVAEGDAALTRRPGLLVGVETADCLPILLVDPQLRSAAAVHAGWRGTAAGIAARTVRRLEAAGSPPERLVAVLGPSIGVCCYEVGEELVEAFPKDLRRFFERGANGRLRLNLRGMNAAALESAGVRKEKISHVDDCTFCLKDLYYSYRRDGPQTGRMMNYVGFSA